MNPGHDRALPHSTAYRFADNQPITVTVDALRGLMLGGDAVRVGETVGGQVLMSLAWSVGIMAVFAPLAVRHYRRIAD